MAHRPKVRLLMKAKSPSNRNVSRAFGRGRPKPTDEDNMIELTIQQNSLAAALNVVTRASKQGGLVPAFELVRLEASSGRLTLTCFNGEFAANGYIPAQCQDLASACVNAGTLREVVQAVEGEVTLRFDESDLRLASGSNNTIGLVMPGYPGIFHSFFAIEIIRGVGHACESLKLDKSIRTTLDMSKESDIAICGIAPL